MHDFRVHSLFNVHTQKCCSAVSHSIGVGTAEWGGGGRAPNVFAKIYITKPIILFFLLVKIKISDKIFQFATDATALDVIRIITK